MFSFLDQSATFNFPTKIHFGTGVAKLVPQSLQNANLSRPLLVTDRGVAELDEFKSFLNQLNHSGLEPTVYHGVHGNPDETQVDAGVTAFKEGDCDSVVAFGGGAAMDVAKVIALMAHHPGHMFDYEDGIANARPVDQKIPLSIAIPTTSGTGSEVGRASVVSDCKTKRKVIIFDPKLLPAEVFLDPLLSINLPPAITAATGLDALTHLIEAFLAKGFNPLTDGLALHGIRLVSENLLAAYSSSKAPDPGSEDQVRARAYMAVAATMGATAFQKGLGVNHSCAHALSTVTDMHHGLANGVMLPYCMAFNAKTSESAFAQMAEAARCGDTSDDFLKWLKKLNTELGIPRTLGELGVKESDLDALTEAAFLDGCHQQNPRPVKESDFAELFLKP